MKSFYKISYWTSRILGILLILFISMFALDEFDNGITFQSILGVLIHLIPSYFLIAALIIAWKCETIGGLIYLLLPVLFLWLIRFNFKFLVFDLLVIGILLLISTLFLIQPRLRKRI